MEELNTALARLIEQATTGIDASVGFLQAQLPDVVVQLLMWHGVKSGLLFAIGWVALFFLIRTDVRLGKRCWNSVKGKPTYDQDDFWFGYCLAGTVARVAYIPFLIVAIDLTWLQIWIAPKVWLLEYAANLVR